MAVPPLPHPPIDPSSLPTIPTIEIAAAAEVLYRMHKTGKHFHFFGEGLCTHGRKYRCRECSESYRFDDPEGIYGTIYFSTTDLGAFIETLGSQISVFHSLSRFELDSRSMTKASLSRKIILAHLRSDHLISLGLDERIATTDDYQITQEWSRFLWTHPQKLDGICYRARHDGEQISIALFITAAAAIDLSVSTTEDLADTSSLTRKNILSHYRIRLV